ncbi:MAG: carbohydrate ABC transporter permease [Pseudomonadota bacterium]|jgi:multiple sugar transport system permease protein|nr:carbohydrate ABC transporter permease [Pseudomonadota bacterium]
MLKRKIYRLSLYIALFAVIVFYAGPLLIVVSTSLKTDTQTMSRTFELIPDPLILDQYQIVLERFPFSVWLRNSFIVAVLTVALVLFVSLPAGYAFARLEFKGKNLLFTLSLLSIMIPFVAYIPQLYLLMYYLDMLNKFIALVIPLATSGVSIFMFRQFMSQIPRDLDDAAVMDGCNPIQIFFHVILPLSKPAIVSVVIFTAIKSWNTLMWPLIAASNNEVKTVPVGLAVNVFAASSGTIRQQPYGVIMAAAFLSIIIPVTLFLFLQKYFVQGIATTGLK